SSPDGPSTTPPSVVPTQAPTAAPSANRAPTVEFQAFEPRTGIILRITQVAFAAKASDPDGDPLTYAWDFDDGQTEVAGAGISHIFDKAGRMNVTVRVQDGRGGQAAV